MYIISLSRDSGGRCCYQVAWRRESREFGSAVVLRLLPRSPPASDVSKHLLLLLLLLLLLPAVILLEDRCRQMLRNSIGSPLPRCPPLFFLLTLLFFSSGLFVGRQMMVAWSRQQGGGTWGEGVLCFVLSSSPAVFPVTFSHAASVAAKCHPERLEKKGRVKYILRENGLIYPLLSCHTHTEDC